MGGGTRKNGLEGLELPKQDPRRKMVRIIRTNHAH